MWATCLGSGLSAAVAEVPAGSAFGEDGIESKTEASSRTRDGGEGGENAAAGRAAVAGEEGEQTPTSYTYTQLFMDALPFVVLYDMCLLLLVSCVMSSG